MSFQQQKISRKKQIIELFHLVQIIIFYFNLGMNLMCVSYVLMINFKSNTYFPEINETLIQNNVGNIKSMKTKSNE